MDSGSVCVYSIENNVLGCFSEALETFWSPVFDVVLEVCDSCGISSLKVETVSLSLIKRLRVCSSSTYLMH